jgi:hypothetical protein
MEIRRTTYLAAIKLATVLSVVAATIALGLGSLGEASQAALVLSVIAVGFVASWVQTGRAARSADHRRGHRLTMVPLRHPVG